MKLANNEQNFQDAVGSAMAGRKYGVIRLVDGHKISLDDSSTVSLSSDNMRIYDSGAKSTTIVLYAAIELVSVDD